MTRVSVWEAARVGTVDDNATALDRAKQVIRLSPTHRLAGGFNKRLLLVPRTLTCWLGKW